MRIPRLLCCLLALASLPAAAREGSYRQVGATPLGGPDRWDYVLFDPAGSLVFVAHGDRADVVDARTGRVLGRVAPLDGAHGTAVAPEIGRGFADGGGSRSLTAFDLRTLRPIRRLPAGEDADAVSYDPFSRRVFVMNGDSGTISVFDAVRLEPVSVMRIGGKLEFGVSDGRGALFVNLASEGAVARIDTRTATVTARWPVPACLSPHGLAYDDATRRLFTSCVDGALKVLDAGSGAVVASLPIGKGSDSVAVDPRRRLAFSANGSGSLSVIAIRDAGHFDVLPALPTPRGTRTMAVDPATGRIFLASATVDAQAPPSPSGRPRFVANSLRLLLLDPQ